MKNLAMRLVNIKSILVVFIVLGVLYSVVTPIFEASDEVSHYAVIQHIIDTSQLPVQQPGVKTAWEQEGSQPPLYYLLMAGATNWIDTGDAADRMNRNPHAAPGDPSLDANRNLVIHSPAEDFPWQKTTLAVHLIRFMSIVMGAFTVLLGHAIGRMIFPARRSLALGTAALIAFNPMFLFITASVNNDNLVILLSSLALYLAILCWNEPAAGIDRAGWLRRIGLGVVVGLAALTKISGLTLLLPVGLVLTVRHLRRRDWRGWIFSGLLIGALIVLIAGWWYVRNQNLYHDPLGLNAMVAIAGPRPAPMTLGQLVAEFDGFRYSYWALFGAVNIVTLLFAYTLFDAFSLLAFIGWLISLFVAWREKDRERLALMIILAIFVLAVFIGVVRWTMMTSASQGRLMFPAITIISLIMWLGWDTIWSGLKNRWARLRWSMPIFMLALAIVVPFRDIAPTYTDPTPLAADQVPPDITMLDVNYGSTFRLIGYRLPAEAASSDSIDFTLYWQCLTQPTIDYGVFVIVYGRQLTEVGKRDAYPYHGLYGTRQCAAGTIFADPYRIPINAAAARPTVLRVQVGLKDFANGLELRPTAGGQPISALIFIGGKLGPAAPLSTPEHLTDLQFGDSIRLIGYASDSSANPAGTLKLSLFWQATARPPEAYQVFVHRDNSQGKTIVPADSAPLNGDYPTDWWSAGETIVDDHLINLPSDLPGGNYHLAIGLYRLADDTRLPVTDAAGQALPANQIILEPVIHIPN